MLFKDWGEENFIQHLMQHFPSKSPIVGIGDDCAVIPDEAGKAWLVTTDALIEGIHFLKGQISGRDLGYKTVAVNVSDITAMGGEPKFAFLSIAMPKMIDRDTVLDVIRGIKDACDKWGLLLLGGDTIGSKRDLFLNMTLVGSASQEKIKYRHQANTGDIICVTGYLGDAGGGLRALQENINSTEDTSYLIQAHFQPDPNPSQGLWLAMQNGVHAMMDISDGLDSDLKRLIKSSQKGAIVETTQLPISVALARASSENEWDSLQLALTGGEDYCLLLTIDSDVIEDIQKGFREKFGVPLYAIGRITDPPIEVKYYRNEELIQMRYENFDHFR